MKRLFDFATALLFLIIFSVPMLVIALLIKLTSKGPVLYWSDRVGKNNLIFRMPKFRTMHLETPVVATHLLVNPNQYITSIGNILRKSNMDELPQLFSILKGDMSFVGPRPALYNQDDLIEMRTEKEINALLPGLTGWAQISSSYELPIPVKVEFDYYYFKNKSFVLDLIILYKTLLNVMQKIKNIW